LKKIFFIIPPLTQLNTPYPATTYLKGFLNQYGYDSSQADLGLELILELFSSSGVTEMFTAAKSHQNLPGKYKRMLRMADSYIQTVEPVIHFLQHKNPTLAHRICNTAFLPRGARFEQMEDLDWAFGTMGIEDQARFLSTLFLEDLGDFIRDVIDKDFGFSRYAEKIARTATLFDPIDHQLKTKRSIPIHILEELLLKKLELFQPEVACITIPFHGNLFGGLKCGQLIKKYYPSIKVVIGGGYVNTELRELKDPKIFKYVDYILLDDGETPLLKLLEYFEGKGTKDQLIRTFTCKNEEVKFLNNGSAKDIDHSKTGTPDYCDLRLGDYLSIIEVANPMHRLWSDGRWNKLTLAHGCYWHKCSFCDTTLDYIRRYNQAPVSVIIDRIETIIQQTGQTGFHFVDEAAPPRLLKDLALELIRRNICITWWTNIRFEKSFSKDLCKLLALSGCVAVSGGLEVASDRLLAMMNKGVTLQQVTQATYNLSQAGIMVHAYLMYGFPTETERETMDSLEVVRQMVESELIHSGFWHCFAMTEHSPIGENPEQFRVKRIGPDKGTFANNDLWHEDPLGTNHELLGYGLRKALYNYMRGVGFDLPLQYWFEKEIPGTTIPQNLIERFLDMKTVKFSSNQQLLLITPLPEVQYFEQKRKGKKRSMMRFIFSSSTEEKRIKTNEKMGNWIKKILPCCTLSSNPFTFGELEESYQNNLGNDFSEFLKTSVWEELKEILLIL